MECRYCGQRLKDGYEYCPNCGGRVEPAEQQGRPVLETASSARSDVCKFPCVIGRNDPAQPGAGLEHAVDTALRFLPPVF